MTRPVDIGEIAQMMRNDAAEIVEELLPGAERQGRTRIVADGLLGGRGTRWSCHLVGATCGYWQAFAGADIPGAPDRGDILDLVAWVLFDGDKRQAFAWGLKRYGFADRGPDYERKLEQRRADLKRRQEERDRKALEDDTRRMNRAFHVWNAESRPIVSKAGEKTPAAIYLEGRGVDLSRLASLGSLRFHPTIRPQNGDPHGPAMVSIMANSLGEARACHLTALDARPDGRVVKSDRVQNAKVIWGKPVGCFVSISKGASGKTMRNAPEGDVLAICEGIEDALTLAMARPDLRIVAAGTLGLMGEIAPPATVKRIIIYRDRDPEANWRAREAFGRTLTKQLERAAPIGREIRVAEPPPGFKDANEALQNWKSREGARDAG